MTVHADVTAVAGGRNGSPWSHLTADSHAELPESSCADHDSRTASRRTDPHDAIDLETSGMTTLSAISASTRLDSGGTTWRLRSLIAMGHDSSRIARAMNVRPERIRKLVRGDTATVSPEFCDLVCQLWNAWWDKRPPEATLGERRTASTARRRAERNSWPAAAGLDEDQLDDPGYRPFCCYRPAEGTGIACDFRPSAERPHARQIA
jgi:hypothetical protein